MTKQNEMQAKMEAVLFALGEPVSILKLAMHLQIKEQECRQHLMELQKKYESTNAGIMLLFLEDHAQLTTKQKYEKEIKLFFEEKKSVSLSPAAMEVLAVIAYNQPVTRGFIEEVRGIHSNHLVSGLLEKELICEAGRLEVPGKPMLYKTTKHFLRCFGLQSLEELPVLEDQRIVTKEEDRE